MKQKGGKRKGAGRKKGGKNEKTIVKEKQKEIFENFLFEAVMKEKGEIITSLIQSAKDKNVQALKEILERVMGRVVEKKEIDLHSDEIKVIGDALKKLAETK